ncbi:MAG: quinolinate synthase NadA [Eubacterium sp.]|nr:quinolinate synthase NadA [Eubacterium sp.]
MTIQEMQDEIIRIKKEKNICILAHAYQNHEILEVADYMGDSYGLALNARDDDKQTVLMCGVRFMAETVKIISPDKKVVLVSPDAGCPMAEQMDIEYLKILKQRFPEHTVVAYINTTAELKTLCDVCVTSSAALKIVKNIDNDKILFIPDPNLGQWIKEQLPEKDIQLFTGGCPTHYQITEEEAVSAKAKHPDALLLVHPECRPEVTALADYAGSTTGIMSFAEKSDNKEFIIGTENSIVSHLQYKCPDKVFYALSKNCVCHNMRLTTLGDVYMAVKGIGGEEIILSDEVRTGAKKCIDAMLTLGG